LTPDEIIRDFGHKDAATHYLVRIEGGKKVESYQGRGGVEIKLQDGMCFQIIAVGPMPVSDGVPPTGVKAFVQGLLQLGYAPSSLPDKPDHIVFDYQVQSGRFDGTRVRLGFIVPPDFPLIVPTGPHVSPHIHPINPPGTHPTGGIHQEQAKPFEAAGGQWQYWSRPFNEAKRTVATYMSHIWRLWDSQ
jgi:hypothetical protein